ncbi:MAG: substrate-binding periplasmic protein [Inhella sp.]
MTRRQLIALALATWAAKGHAAKSWKVYGPERYEPLLHKVDGKPSGLLAERLLAASRYLGESIDLELTAWSRALALSKEGQGGLIGVSKTPDRERWLDYSRPIHFDDLVLVVRAGQAFPFKGLSDLKGKTLGLARDSTGGPAFDAALNRNEFRVIRDETAVQRLLALHAGRIDAAVVGGGSWTLQRALGQHPQLRDHSEAFEVLRTPLLRDALHLAFPKPWRTRALLARFDAAWASLDLTPK